MNQSEEKLEETGEGKRGFWGSTLSKLKTALSRTKTAIVDSATGPDEESAEEAGGEVHAVSSPTGSSESAFAAADAPARETGAVDASPSVLDLSARGAVEPSPQPVESPPVPAEPEPAPVRATAEQTRRTLEEATAGGGTTSGSSSVAVDDEYLEDLEEKLIKADLGLATAETLVGDLRKQSRGRRLSVHDVRSFLKSEFLSILTAAPKPELRFEPGKLNVYLIVGVNGTGKTTSIGKLAWRFKQEGKRVLLAAGDTFRAAAESQLEIWAGRADVDIVRLPDGSDPGAVVFNALDRAKKDGYDCLLIDTAGRLHNKAHLMAELKKVRSVVDKHGAGLPLEVLLVLDASTGQNGLQQAKLFTDVASLTGVVLTKLDGSAKGGIVFSIARDLDIPVKLIGLGEQMDDLRDFEPEMFVEALF